MKQRKILKTPIFIAVYAAVIVACVALDQLTKLWIFDGLLQGGDLSQGVDVLGKFLRFEPVYNPAAAFGIGNGDAANIVFFVITVLGIPLFCVLLWRSRTRSVWGQIGYAFIVGGTIGNAVDRAFVHNTTGAFFGGEVRDFIAFSFFPPVFNIADSFLTVGVVMAILALIFFDPDGLVAVAREEKAKQNASVESSDDISENSIEALADSGQSADEQSPVVGGKQPPDVVQSSKASEVSSCESQALPEVDKNLQNSGDVHEKS